MGRDAGLLPGALLKRAGVESPACTSAFGELLPGICEVAGRHDWIDPAGPCV